MASSGKLGAGALLLTGAPGVGKTTVSECLCRHDPGVFRSLRFGRYVYEAVLSRTGEKLEYQEFRQNSAAFVTEQDIHRATDKAELVIRDQTRASKITVVDSHAVSKEHYGWRAVPDGPRLLAKFGYSWVIQLYAPPELVIERTRRSPGGRLAETAEDVAAMQALQFSTSTYYAATLGKPLHVVSNTGPVDRAVEAVLALLRG
jgi:adenylate kinase